MGLIHDVIKRKKMLAPKTTIPPSPTNNTQDTTREAPKAKLEIGDALNLDQILLTQVGWEDRSNQVHLTSEGCSEKSHVLRGEKFGDGSKSTDTSFSKRDKGKDMTHKEHHVDMSKSM